MNKTQPQINLDNIPYQICECGSAIFKTDTMRIKIIPKILAGTPVDQRILFPVTKCAACNKEWTGPATNGSIKLKGN